MRRAWAVAAALLVLAGGWVLWRRMAGTSIEPGACAGCNVLLVTIDTLRVDRVGAFGGPAGLTPTLDQLANEGLRLTRAYSSAPLTLPSHASILTAVSPPVHGLRANGLFRLGPNLPTLATVLKSSGYRTGAFVGAFVLDSRFGLNRGFDVYDDKYGEKHEGDLTEGAERRAEDVVKPAARWILDSAAAGGSPFFAWVHLYDPHEPYRAPEPYASRYPPYDAEVAYTDATLGRFLSDLRAAGQLDRTLIVVAADHGESLGEHGERTHGVFVYDATVRVPWIVWAGSRIRAGTYDRLVRLIDLAPTVLDLTGVPIPQSFEGRSILGAVASREAPPAAAYLEAMDANLTRNWAPLTAIVSDTHKLIDLPVPELYDLSADPHEAANLYSREGERARALGALLRDLSSGFAARGSASEKTNLSAEARQRLQALGYVASSTDGSKRVFTEADDPKALIGVSDALNQAVTTFNQGKRTEGMAAAKAIMSAHPGFPTAFGTYASMQRQTGDLAGAIATLDTIVRRGVADQRVMVVLAGYLFEAGAADKSIGLLEAVIAAHPDEVEAYNSLGAVQSQRGRHAEAQAAYRKVLELDPNSAKAYENIGVDDLRAGNRVGAVANLQHALELDSRLAAAHNALATAYMLDGKMDDAVGQWRQAIDLNPRLYDALFNLGMALFDAGRRDEARPILTRFVETAPPDRYQPDIARLRALLERR